MTGEPIAMAGDTTNTTDLQDHELAEAARRGRRPALEELHRRHGGTTWRLALAVTRRPAPAAAAVAAGWATVLTGRKGRSGAVADRDVRSALLRATRHAALDLDHHDGPAHPPAALAFEGTDAAVALTTAAFAGIPERWRSVIWLLDVERLPLDEVGRALELAPDATASLADRARHGLREQALHRSVDQSDPLACRRTADRLGAYVDETLAEADEARVRGHLDGCDVCRDRLAMIDDLVPALRSSAHPAPVDLGEAIVACWAVNLARGGGPLRLRFPGGRPIPTWARRTIVGGVGAAVALGVIGATMLSGGRGSRLADASTPSAAIGAADGEGALGLSDLVLDGEGFVPPSFGGAAGAAGTGAGPTLDELARAGAPLPRATSGSGSGSQLSDGLLPLPGTGGGTTSSGSNTTTPPPPPPPPPPGPEDDSLTAGIGGVITLTVGEECTGADLLGTAVGCEPEATDEPVTLPAVPLTTDPIAPLTTSLGL